MKYNAPYGVSDPNAPYINGNPSTGTMGSIPPAESIEYPQREIVEVITAAGLAPPDNADLHQLAKAIQSLLMNSKNDAGTANAYQVTLAPAPNAVYEFLTVVMKVANTNTGPSVLNVNALGAKNIVRSDGSPVVAGDLTAGRLVCLVYDGTNFQLVWSGGGGVSGQPIYLTAARDYYVNDATGNDAYDGTVAAFSSGAHGPFKTLQRAANEINKFNLNGFNIQVHVADSLNYASVILPNAAGSGIVTWTGNPATPANCKITGTDRTAISQTGPCGTLQIVDGFALYSTGNQSTHQDTCNCLNVGGGGILQAQNIEFVQSVGFHMYVLAGALKLYGNLRIIGGSLGGSLQSSGHLACNLRGTVQVNGITPPTLTIVNPTTVGVFVQAFNVSICSYFFASISGTLHGQRYAVYTNSVVDSNAGGVNYFPGDVAGAVASGGQYV